jgi:hypothetical protein
MGHLPGPGETAFKTDRLGFLAEVPGPDLFTSPAGLPGLINHRIDKAVRKVRIAERVRSHATRCPTLSLPESSMPNNRF